MELPQKHERFTYGDYKLWDHDRRWEIIDGVAHAMAPAPSLAHQTLIGEILTELNIHLRGKPCKALAAPVDVRFEESDDTDTVVQPDIIVVCDPLKMREEGIVGAPDLVVEVLSPSSMARDMFDKLHRYRSAGVAEYWIVSPEDGAIFQHVLQDGQYEAKKVSEGMLVSARIQGFKLDIAALFASLQGIPR